MDNKEQELEIKKPSIELDDSVLDIDNGLNNESIDNESIDNDDNDDDSEIAKSLGIQISTINTPKKETKTIDDNDDDSEIAKSLGIQINMESDEEKYKERKELEKKKETEAQIELEKDRKIEENIDNLSQEELDSKIEEEKKKVEEKKEKEKKEKKEAAKLKLEEAFDDLSNGNTELKDKIKNNKLFLYLSIREKGVDKDQRKEVVNLTKDLKMPPLSELMEDKDLAKIYDKKDIKELYNNANEFFSNLTIDALSNYTEKIDKWNNLTSQEQREQIKLNKFIKDEIVPIADDLHALLNKLTHLRIGTPEHNKVKEIVDELAKSSLSDYGMTTYVGPTHVGKGTIYYRECYDRNGRWC